MRPILVTLALLAPLAAPSAASALIQVDKGIAGARLGNSRADVRKALGTPASAPVIPGGSGSARSSRTS
jgi:hypothetical protein